MMTPINPPPSFWTSVAVSASHRPIDSDEDISFVDIIEILFLAFVALSLIYISLTIFLGSI